MRPAMMNRNAIDTPGFHRLFVYNRTIRPVASTALHIRMFNSKLIGAIWLRQTDGSNYKLFDTEYFTVSLYTGPIRMIRWLLRPDRGAEYCDECVCLCECLSLRDQIFRITRPVFANFCACYLWPYSSIVLWRRSDTLRISGSMDDVIFAHKLRLLEVAARLRQWGSHAALGLARKNTRRRQRTIGTTSCSQGLLGHR